MNPLTNMKNVKKLSERELDGSSRSSWHDQYKNSAWIFFGGVPFTLSEGDLICIFSQYGEVVHINLVRHKETGKSLGYGFICFEDQRSTNLTVDNLNGVKVMHRTIRVDHVSEYKVPKEERERQQKAAEEASAPAEDLKPTVKRESVAVKAEPVDVRETLVDQIGADVRLPARLPIRMKQEELRAAPHIEQGRDRPHRDHHAELSDRGHANDDDYSHRDSAESTKAKKRKHKSKREKSYSDTRHKKQRGCGEGHYSDSD